MTMIQVLINALEVSNSTLNRNTDPTQTQHYKDKSRQRNAFSSGMFNLTTLDDTAYTYIYSPNIS